MPPVRAPSARRPPLCAPSVAALQSRSAAAGDGRRAAAMSHMYSNPGLEALSARLGHYVAASERGEGGRCPRLRGM